MAIALYGLCVVAALIVFLPWVRRDKLAAFWFTVMVLAAIPESSLVPISKNFGFVAIGAYGLIASFVAALWNRRLPEQRVYRVLAGSACILLLLVHVPGAIAGRIVPEIRCRGSAFLRCFPFRILAGFARFPLALVGLANLFGSTL